MNDTFEEIKAIYCDNYFSVESNVTMDSRRIFMRNVVEWTIEKEDRWKIVVQFHPITHIVFQIDLVDNSYNLHWRWVSKSYEYVYHSHNFESMTDTSDITMMTEYDASVILDIAHQVIEGDTEEDEEEEMETISLDLNDSELALIARAAHEKDVTINQFVNDALKYELDKLMPDWRDEVKKSV